MYDPLSATIELQDDKVQFSGRLRDNDTVTIDYTPPIGGGQGYTSLELFLFSLASCSGTAVAILLRKMGKNIHGLTVRADGVRREAHPSYFETIHLTFSIQSDNATAESVEKALTTSEESICPVWCMIKNNVAVTSEFSIFATI